MDGDGVLRRELPITNKRGLHARASAKFVQMVEAHEAEVEVTKDSQTVNGMSIMGLMMLGASIGTSIVVEARGPQATEVMRAITNLVENKFFEE